MFRISRLIIMVDFFVMLLLKITFFCFQVVKVWDIKEHSILQTVVLKFPSSIHGRMPEHGQFPMHLQSSPQNSLLVTCNDYIGLLKLGRTSIPRSEVVSTHDTQLCCAIYNPMFKQVGFFALQSIFWGACIHIVLA